MKEITRRCCILLVSLFFTQFIQAQCTLRFSGQVTDADTKERLEGASIRIMESGQVMITDKQGKFSFEGLCPGHYDVVISHIGCGTITTHIHIRDDFSKEFLMPHASSQLSSVTVVGNLPSRLSKDDLKGRQLEAARGLSLGESLQKINGVSVLQTGSSIYKPVIHGLHSNRVIILNNGIRQEGQQWGNEHAPEVDPYIANRLSVIKGASSLRYGADAIGGVVLVEPKLLRATPGMGGEINLAAFSNNRMGVVSGILEGNPVGIPAFSWRAQGTLKRGGNAKTPDYWLDNSGLEEYNFSLTAGWKKAGWGTELFFSQFNTKLGIFSGSHIGNVSDLMTAISSGVPPDYVKNAGFSYTIGRPFQQVQHNLIKSKTFINTGKIGRLNILASWQYNNRKEYDKKRFQSSDNAAQLDLSIGTASLDVVWDHFTYKRFRGTIGTTGFYQNNAYSLRLFIPNYRSAGGGVFWIEKWEKGRWLIDGGIRFDHRSIFDINTNTGRNFQDLNYQSVSYNAGITHTLKDGVQLNVSVSSAWRAPSINELYSDGLHHGAARLEKGDSSLVPERANTLSAGFTLKQGRWDIDLGVYAKWISDFIYLEPVYPPQLTIRGAFPSFRYTQTNARLTGIDASVAYEVTHHINWNARASILRAWNRRAGEWLIQMPADRYETELSYDFHNGKQFRESYMKLSVQHILKQTRVPVTGNIELQNPDGTKYLASDYAPPPPAYTLLNIEAGTQLAVAKHIISLTLSVNNLLNTRYREYMNAFRYYADEMGRNISLRMKVPFEWSPKLHGSK
ncbi:MAG: TonB-dependent receptor [Ferruginibacter sp.]